MRPPPARPSLHLIGIHTYAVRKKKSAKTPTIGQLAISFHMNERQCNVKKKKMLSTTRKHKHISKTPTIFSRACRRHFSTVFPHLFSLLTRFTSLAHSCSLTHSPSLLLSPSLSLSLANYKVIVSLQLHSQFVADNYIVVSFTY